MKRASKFVAFISQLLGIGFGLPKGQLKPFVAQVKARPNIVFVLTDDQMPGTEHLLSGGVERPAAPTSAQIGGTQ